MFDIEPLKIFWLESLGEYSEVIISTRVRLARNISGYPFPSRATREDREKVREEAYSALSQINLFRGALWTEMDGLHSLDRQFLMERHLISKEMLSNGVGGGLMVRRDEDLGVMVNEEDHLRLFALCPGFAPQDAYIKVNELDDLLCLELDIAFHKDYGFLTSCPTNVGTGMRVSVLAHLPGLVVTKRIREVVNWLRESGYSVRGIYGEGSQVVGNIFQISNHLTLGKEEEEIVEGVERVVKKIVSREYEARQQIYLSARLEIEDKIWRAYGTLSHARLVSSEELLGLLSLVRMGVGLGILKGISLQDLNKVMICAQPAHIQKVEGEQMGPVIRDQRRATIIRSFLKGGIGL